MEKELILRPPPVAALGAEVDDPVGRLDDVEVVLDDDDRVAGVDELLQHVEQPADVREVQAGRRLVEDVDRLAGRRRGSSVASFTRCASPPESVVAGWPSLM
jgi:hypothetical protein